MLCNGREEELCEQMNPINGMDHVMSPPRFWPCREIAWPLFIVRTRRNEVRAVSGTIN